jgi:uncharacterized membrane protein
MSQAASVPARRVQSVDVLRGIVMIIMALDHVRDYFGAASVNPTDIATTTVPLFFTRWITHICAPVFFLLTGTGAYLLSQRREKGKLSRYLVTRGLWLIVLEVVIMRCLAWQFNFDFRVTFLIVLWALGWAMITLALLVRWPPAVAAVFGLTLMLGHNLFDGISAASLGAARPIWQILHQPGLLLPGPEYWVLVAYPLVPWVGVTAVGYALGQVFTWEPERRRTFLWRLGIGLTSAFVLLRWLNSYGDPQPWGVQQSPVFTLLSFLNTSKYPPSLLFLLMTLGPALLLLRAFDAGIPKWLRPATVYGRVPLFYFVLHVLLIHVLALVVLWLRYDAVHWAFESPTPDRFPFTQPQGWPHPLPIVYMMWLLVVALLWPVCRWFAALKTRRRDWWLSYM